MHISVVLSLASGMPATEPTVTPVTSWAVPRVLSVALELPAGATVGEAVRASGLMEHLPGVSADALDVGVFNRPCTLDRELEPDDRVEIYRPLRIDPKAARHLRVAARRKAEARARQAAAGPGEAPVEP